MDSKHYVIILISFGIGFIFGFVFGWYPSAENTRNNIITYVVGNISIGVGVGILVKVWDFITERDKKKEQIKLDYSRTLVAKNLIHRVISEVGFAIQNDYDLFIQIKGLPDTPEYKRYSDDVDTCLKEYKKIQKIIKDRDDRIEQHNTKLKSILAKLNSDIVSNLKQNHPTFTELSHTEWAKGNQTPLNYFVKDHLFEIGLFVQYCYEKECIFYLDPDQSETDRWGRGTLWKIHLKVTMIAGIDKKEINDIRNMIIDTFYDAVNSPDFDLLKELFIEIESLHRAYKKEIDLIIIETVDKNSPLKNIKL